MKTTIFLTGATGTMGWQGMHEILKHPERYRLRILACPLKRDRKRLAPLEGKVEIIWGDLRNYDDVLRGVTGSDIVLHVGGMVSPQADSRPKTTREINVGGAVNIRDAVLAQPAERQPKVVYIGSVAMMGDRREPMHWGRTGDPLCVSAFDHYGVTKVLAERILTDSPVRRWVSLRQSGILHPGILKNFDPILFHVPIRGVLEWTTAEDSGRLLERVCRPEVPEDFWKQYYNIGSGAGYRLSNYAFECLLLDAAGCPRPEKIFDTRWFATRNFHGMWYLDGDRLENCLHFRANVPVEAYFAQLARSKELPPAIRFASRTRIAKLFPHFLKLAMWRLSNHPVQGTQRWIRKEDRQRIQAFYGSKEKYEAIPDWKHTDLSCNSAEPVILDHGYDEAKPRDRFTVRDMQRAAGFRGGRCLTAEMKQGDWDTQLEWQCAQGHTFKASPRLVLLGGHWCPACFPYPYPDEPHPQPWQWDALAKHNPFLAQLWNPLHDAGE